MDELTVKYYDELISKVFREDGNIVPASILINKWGFKLIDLTILISMAGFSSVYTSDIFDNESRHEVIDFYDGKKKFKTMNFNIIKLERNDIDGT